MNWLKIKTSIKNDLLSRNLSNPNIRLNALERIEGILKDNLPEYIKKPEKTFRNIDKKELKKKIEKYKTNQKLNDAESSIINEIYYRI